MLTCIAVDDEPLALGLVCAFIEQTPFLKLVGRYSSGVEALRGLNELSVEVVFLDIQMPDLTGLDLARVLESRKDNHTRVIFTTAFNQFALEGYKVDALDYLLKPFNYAEFLRAAQKAQSYFERIKKPLQTTLPEPVSSSPPPVAQALTQEENYLFLKVEYQLVRISLDDILYIEGLKDYVKVHLANSPKPVLSLTSLKALEEKLPRRRFMRIHRSFIVSLEKISAISRNGVQIGTVHIPVSDQYKEVFNQFVSKWS